MLVEVPKSLIASRCQKRTTVMKPWTYLVQRPWLNPGGYRGWAAMQLAFMTLSICVFRICLYVLGNMFVLCTKGVTVWLLWSYVLCLKALHGSFATSTVGSWESGRLWDVDFSQMCRRQMFELLPLLGGSPWSDSQSSQQGQQRKISLIMSATELSH